MDLGRNGRSAGPPSPVEFVDAAAMPASVWDDLAVRSPMGDALQSHAWGETKRRLGWTPLRYVASQAGREIAVVSMQARPVLRQLRGPAGRLRVLYAPHGPVLLEPTPEVAAATLDGLRRLASSVRAVSLTIDPAWDEGSELAAALAGSGFRPAAREIQVSRTAMIVPLEASEHDQKRHLGHTVWQDITRALDLGVTTERVDLANDEVRGSALAEFFDMHHATGLREGFMVRQRAYELEQWQRLGASDVVSLWFAGLGRRDTGALLLHSGRNLVYFAAGSRDDADLRRTRANHLLQWRIIRWAAEAGFEGYDMGGVDTRSAPGLPRDESHPLWNLFLFKRRFGGRPAMRVRAHEYSASPVLGALWRLARRVR